MSSSNIKNFMRKFNVSKPTDMPDIPEEKIGADGRPISMISQHAKSSDKRGSALTTVSELSTATTQVGSGLGIDISKANAPHSPQSGDLLFVPQNVKTPTTFGPNNEYKAVPTVIEYSTARGRSRVSVREATAEEAREAAGQNLPIISEIPDFQRPSAESKPRPLSDVPIIPPPPNFEPIRIHSPPSSDEAKRPSHLRPSIPSQSDTIRSSTTSIRTSTTSIRMSTATEACPRNSSLDNDGDAIAETASLASTLNAPGSPPQSVAGLPKYDDVKGYDHFSGSSVAWPLPNGSITGSSNASMRSGPRIQSYEIPRGATPMTISESTTGSIPGSELSQSQFDWDKSRRERTKNWFTRWFIEWWAMEIFSWLFSAMCMMIIIIVLWKCDGKPQPKWKLGVSINAFIAIFSGFAKSALLLPTAEALGQLKWSWFKQKERRMMDFEVMDSASRGPWGSMVFLAKTKGITLASVGAAIILLSLPLDLFFQQIVTYPSVALADHSANATISRAVQYNPDVGRQWRDGSAVLPWDFAFNAFLYPYWMGTGLDPSVVVNCPSGNCTFDPFYTLGVDYQCVEMPSDILRFGCHNTSAEWLSTVQYQGPGANPNVTSCGYYLDVPGNGLQLMAGYEIEESGAVGEVLATRFFSLMDVMTNATWFDGSINFPNISNPQVDFILASTPGGFDGAIANNTPVVHECEVHWVVNKLQSVVVNGKLTESRLDVLQFESNVTEMWNPDDWNWYLPTFNLTMADPQSVTGEDSSFGMDNTTARGVWTFWTQIAPSSFTRPASNNPVESGPVLKYAWLDSPPHLLQVWDEKLPWDAPQNVTHQLGQAVAVANSIVRRNQMSVTRDHNVAVGTTWLYITLVHIRWEWITLPVALLLFSLAFLFSTMWRSSKDKQQIGIWKTSALAILFNGLGEDVQSFVGTGNKNLGYTREKARNIQVHLED